MQCSETAKPMKAVCHNVSCTVKAKLDFVNVTKLFQKCKQPFWHVKSGRV